MHYIQAYCVKSRGLVKTNARHFIKTKDNLQQTK